MYNIKLNIKKGLIHLKIYIITNGTKELYDSGANYIVNNVEELRKLIMEI